MSVPGSARQLEGSVEAKRLCALMLEAISGLRTTQEAADEMAVSLPRYYQLETRALQAMIQALEKRERGRPRNEAARLEALGKANKELEHQVQRYQALYRTTQRAVGIKDLRSKKTKKVSGKRTRNSRRKARGRRLVSLLRESPDSTSDSMMQPVTASQEDRGIHGNRPPQ